jgi:signal transduction histidine kinase
MPAQFLAAVLFIGFHGVFQYSTNALLERGDRAWQFLQSVNTLPAPPIPAAGTGLALLAIVAATAAWRSVHHAQGWAGRGALAAADLLLAVLIVASVQFGSRGALFIAATNSLRFLPGRGLKIIFAGLAVLLYVGLDPNLLALVLPVTSLQDYMDFQTPAARLFDWSVFNGLNSLSETLFIAYLVFEILGWAEENAEIRRLNVELVRTTEDLRLTGAQWEAYAARAEELARGRERDRLAQTIHDIVAHSLTGIAVGLKACLEAFDHDRDRVRAQMAKIQELSLSGLTDMRLAVAGLRQSGVSGSLPEDIRQLASRIAQVTDTQIEVDIEGSPRGLPPTTGEVLYRSAQEGLTNAIRHGQARRIDVGLRFNEETVELAVLDDGAGAAKSEGGTGLRSMQERAEALGGYLHWANRSPGFMLQISLPAPRGPV